MQGAFPIIEKDQNKLIQYYKQDNEKYEKEE